MMAVYNDEDFISEVLENAFSQGIKLVLLDDGSTDSTYKICEGYLDKGVLEIQKRSSKVWNQELNLEILYHMALRFAPDWVVLYGSDELLESSIQNTNLKNGIAKADSAGFNSIQFDWFDFFMTDNDNNSTKTIKEKLLYYSWSNDYLYRAWKYIPGIRIFIRGGHYPIFPDGHSYKIYPNKFVLRHYKFRSNEQAKKMLLDRIKRLQGSTAEKLGWSMNRYKYALENEKLWKVKHNMTTE